MGDGSLLGELEAIEERLDARRARRAGLARLQELFGSARAHDPVPEGFFEGRPLALSVSAVLDRLVRRIADFYTPWLGKRFEPSAAQGINVLAPSAQAPMRLLWPSYIPERELVDRIEAFPFKVWRGAGEVDREVETLKVDYSWDRSPDPLVRRLRDDLVELEDGLLLGKSLLRVREGYRELGYFSLKESDKPATRPP